MTNRSRTILALILTYMIFAVLLNSVGTLILQAQRAMGASQQAVSVLDAFKDLPIAIVSFLVASLLPMLGYRRGMMLGLALVAIACAAMPLFNTFWMLKALLATTGVAFALVKVSMYSSIGLLTDNPQSHASLTSTIEGWYMIGVLAGPWLFAYFIRQQAGPTDPVWLSVYWVLALACICIIGLLSVTSLDEQLARDSNGNAVHSFAEMFRLLALPLVVIFLVSAFLYVLIEQGIGTWLPTFNADILHLSAVTSVQIASLFAACTAIGRLGAGFILRRISWYWLLTGCLLILVALVLSVLPLTANVVPAQDGWFNAPLAAFVLPMIGLFMAPIYPTINSVVLSALPKSRHAAMTGLIVVFSALGGTTGSFVTGQAFAHLGGTAAFYLLLLPIGMLLVTVKLFKRQSTRSRMQATSA